MGQKISIWKKIRLFEHKNLLSSMTIMTTSVTNMYTYKIEGEDRKVRSSTVVAKEGKNSNGGITNTVVGGREAQ